MSLVDNTDSKISTSEILNFSYFVSIKQSKKNILFR